MNLAVTLAMFLVLVFRAWIEWKNMKVMWGAIQREREYRTVARILKAEKELFTRLEGGEELYNILIKIFET